MPRKKDKKAIDPLEKAVRKEDILKMFDKVMFECDEVLDELFQGYQINLDDFSGQLISSIMSIEFSYTCYRNRLKLFMETILTEMSFGADHVQHNEDDSFNQIHRSMFGDRNIDDIIEYARASLQPTLKSVMIADRDLFNQSLLQRIAFSGEVDPETLINVPDGGEA